MLSWSKYLWLQDAWINNAAAGVSEADARSDDQRWQIKWNFLTLLTIDRHFHVEGEQDVSTCAPRADHADIGAAVVLLDLRHFGHRARVGLRLALHGNPTGPNPDDVGGNGLWFNTGHQPQGAEQPYGGSRGNGD